MPQVFNKHHKKHSTDAVYVGRGSRWGNPYRMPEDGTREEVIKRFEEVHLPKMLAENPNFLVMLRGKDLVCYCAPKACHADILLREANK